MRLGRFARRWTLRRIAGVAYLVPVANIAAIGYMLLFVVPRGHAGAFDGARELLVDDPQAAIFRWLAMLALLCLALAIAYLSGAVKTLPRVLASCGAGAALAAGAWGTLDVSICRVVSLPLCFSVPDAAWFVARRGSITA
jgi:hypothetical protein